MAQSASVAFASMMASSDLIVDNVVTLDIPGASQYDDVSIAVESVEIDKSMTTTAPAATRMWTGYPTVSATIVLSGLLASGDLTAEELLNPYNPASPIFRELLLGCGVKVQAGLWVGDAVPELLDQFTGIVDSYDLDPLNGTVTLNCLDCWAALSVGAEFLTVPMDPFVYTMIFQGSQSAPAQLYSYPGLTSLAIIDRVLRQNGIYASPDQRSGCVMFAPLAGTALPTLFDVKAKPTWAGTSQSFVNLDMSLEAPQRMQWVPGKFTGQVPRDFSIYAGINRYSSEAITATKLPVLDMTRGWFYEGWTRFDPALAWQSDSSINYTQPSLAVSVTSGSPLVSPVFPPDDIGVVAPYAPARTQGFTIQANTNDLGAAERGAEWVFVVPSGAQFALTGIVDGAWQQVDVQVSMPNATTLQFVVWIDQVAVLTCTDTVPTTRGNWPGLDVTIVSTLPGESVQVTNEVGAAPLGAFTPGAYLDASLNPLTSMIDESQLTPGALLQLAADAEFAAVEFDESGIFRFQNRVTLRTAPAGPIMSQSADILDVQFSAQRATYYDAIEVPITSVAVSDFGTLYAGPNNAAIKLPPRSTPPPTRHVDIGSLITAVSTYIYPGQYPIDGVPGSGEFGNSAFGCGARYALSADGTIWDVGANLRMEAWQSGPSEISYTLWNPRRLAMFLVTPGNEGYSAGNVGHPFFAINGRVITFGQSGAGAAPGGEQIVAAAANTGGGGNPTPITGSAPSIAPAVASWGAGSNPLPLSANDLVQDADTAEALAWDVLEDVLYPRPVINNVSLIADPRRQLGDRTRVYDADGSRMDDDVIIVAQNTRISAIDWTQTPTLRTVAQPGYWVIGEAGKSELAATAWT